MKEDRSYWKQVLEREGVFFLGTVISVFVFWAILLLFSGQGGTVGSFWADMLAGEKKPALVLPVGLVYLFRLTRYSLKRGRREGD